jgi:hypothetical protein
MKSLYILFLEDSREVDLYEDLQRLLMNIEGVDVRSGMYDLYDSEGWHFALLVEDDCPRATPDTFAPERLRGKILEFYSRENSRIGDTTSTLDELVAELRSMYKPRG